MIRLLLPRTRRTMPHHERFLETDEHPRTTGLLTVRSRRKDIVDTTLDNEMQTQKQTQTHRRRRSSQRLTCWWTTTTTQNCMVLVAMMTALLTVLSWLPSTCATDTVFTTCRLCSSDNQVPVQPDLVLEIRRGDPPVTCDDVYNNLNTVTNEDECRALLELVTPLCECTTPRPCSVCPTYASLVNPHDNVTWTTASTTQQQQQQQQQPSDAAASRRRFLTQQQQQKADELSLVMGVVESSLPCWQFVDIPNVTDPSSDCALLLDVAAPVCHCAIPAPTTLPLTLAPTPSSSSNSNNDINGTWPPSATPAPTYQEPCDLRCHNNTNNTNNTSSNTTATNNADFENNATSVQGGGGINRTLQVTIAGTVISCGQLLDWAEQRFLSPEVCDAASQSLCGECPVVTTATASPVVDDIVNTTTTVTTLPPTATPLTTEIGRDVSSGAGGKTTAASATAAGGCLLVLLFLTSSSSWRSLA